MPIFYVSNFIDPDLYILTQLVRDPAFAQVYGDTIARTSLQ